VYERLINCCDDPGTKDALQFLMTREITHMKAFMLALESLGKPPLSVGLIPPTQGLVDQYFNDSTGESGDGFSDMTGPWSDAMEVVEEPAFQPEEMKVDGEGVSQAGVPQADGSLRRAPRKQKAGGAE
jgi:manganese catalase